MAGKLLVIINYANESEVLTYLERVSEQIGAEDVKICIVNNKVSTKEHDLFVQEIHQLILDVMLYYPSDNLGYLGGVLWGYGEFIKDNEKPDWVIMSNTDIEFTSTSLLDNMLSKTYSEDIWCIAPSVYNTHKGTYDNPKYKERIPAKKIRLTMIIHSWHILSVLYLTVARARARKRKNSQESSQFAYALQGCFLLLKGEFVQVIYQEGYRGFLYSEENYIAELLRLRKKRSFYDASFQIKHNESSTTSLMKNRKRSKYYLQSLQYIYRTFYEQKS